jgi:two-component system response regulator
VTPPVLLLIEDDRDYVDVIVRALRKAGLGVEFRVARDGQEALDALGLDAPRNGNGDGDLPRVVFLDLKMPRVDGWEVLRRMRASPRTASLPVVVVSSSDRPEDIQRCYALGANSYLLKRFDPRGPGADLAEAARYWIEMNQVTRKPEPVQW